MKDRLKCLIKKSYMSDHCCTFGSSWKGLKVEDVFVGKHVEYSRDESKKDKSTMKVNHGLSVDSHSFLLPWLTNHWSLEFVFFFSPIAARVRRERRENERTLARSWSIGITSHRISISMEKKASRTNHSHSIKRQRLIQQSSTQVGWQHCRK